MSVPISTAEPPQIIAGDTIKWRRFLPDWPADGWTLTYTLVNATSRIIITAAPDGDGHLVNLPATTTAAYTPGDYAWRAQVSNAGGDVYTVGSGLLQIQPGWATATDTRSHAAKTLQIIEAYLENPNNLAAAQYEISGRSLSRHPLPQLLAMRDRYRAEVDRETAAARMAAGLSPRGRIAVRFGLR